MANKQTKNNKLMFSMMEGHAKPIPTFTERFTSSNGYVRYGMDNRFPNYLWELYLRSAILQSIVEGICDYVAGNEIKYSEDPTVRRLSDMANKDGETLDDIIKKLTTDYTIFGGFALQIIRNKLGEISEIYWLDFRNCRRDKEETKVYYSDDWVRHAYDYVEYDVFDPNVKKNTSVFYFKGHITRGVYPIPRYNGALAAIETSTEISKFHLSSIMNNFSGNFIINYNNTAPSEEEQRLLEQQIKDKFTGAENAGSFMLVFNENKDSAVSVERIQDDNFDEKYQSLRKDTLKEIFCSFRAQPQLFGIQSEGNVFNKEEYTDAFALFNRTVIQPIQRDIARSFNYIFGVDESVSFTTFSLYSDINDSQPQNITEE